MEYCEVNDYSLTNRNNSSYNSRLSCKLSLQ